MIPVFEPIWSWPVVVALIAGLLTLILFTYPPRLAHLSSRHRTTLVSLRILAVLALALSLLRPSFELRESDATQSLVLVLADRSRSMTTPDGPGGLTRRQTLLKALEDAGLQDTDEDNLEIEWFDFDSQLRPADILEDAADGDLTAMGAILAEARRHAEGRRLVAIVLAGDGAQRAVPPDDQDPVIVARQLGDERIPIYTLPVGSQALSNAQVDVAVEDLIVDPIVFEKQVVPVTARIRAQGAAGRRLTVRLSIEDRSGLPPGDVAPMQIADASRGARPVIQVEVEAAAQLIPVDLSFFAGLPGEFKIGVEVLELDGEIQRVNNRLETIVTVRPGGLRVAYFDRLRFEQKFLKRLRTSNKIQLDVYLVREGPFADRNRIPPDLFAAGEYDVYVIGDVPAATFGQGILEALSERVDEGAGLMMLGGYQNYAAGGYGRTALRNLLPVEMRGGDANPQIEGELEMEPTRLGQQRYVMRLESDPTKNVALWRSLPKLEGATRLQPKADLAEVWAATSEGLPLLIAQEVGQARVLAFAADTTWLWALGDDPQRAAYETFWNQVILWLAHKESDSDQSVWVSVEPRNFAPRQSVPLKLGARDENGVPVTDVDWQVQVLSPDDSQYPLQPSGQDQQFVADFRETTVPGDYWVKATAVREGASLGTAWTRFIVDARDLELDQPAADPGLLAQLAELSGGAVWEPGNLDQRWQTWLETGWQAAQVDRIRRIRLWDNWPFLAVFVGLMTCEWALRKKRGFV